LNPHSNIHDFWPHLVDKWGRYGDPEDYEIWCDQAPLRGPLIEGLTYEIVPRSSPGRAKPSARRSSIDLGIVPRSEPLVSVPPEGWAPRPLRDDEIHSSGVSIWRPARPIPQQWQARVVFQSTEAPEKEWRGWFTEEDTEFDVERRAHPSLGIIGTWRRSAFWQDESGLTITMTNRRKEIPLRYSGEGDGEIKSILIGENDTVRVILAALKTKSNFHLTDHENHPFGLDDFPFGYVSVAVNPPLKLLHGSELKGKKREPTPKRDNRMAIEVRFSDARAVYARNTQGSPLSYAKLLSDAVSNHSIPGPCHIERVRAEDDRILVDIVLGDDTPWYT
jgi:hypothetical protein